MNTSICEAIQARAVIRFYYDGGARSAEPHCHGISKAGNEVLRAYQTGGHSESGNPVGWKMLDVGKIIDIHQTEEIFSTNRPGYNPNDSHMTSIHCCV